MIKKSLYIFLICAGLVACNMPSTNPTPKYETVAQVATSVAATQQALQVESTQPGTELADETSDSETQTLLPHALYYLNVGDGENSQVWRLSKDGKTNTIITTEPDGVDEFSVSQSDGKVAYITNNQLYIIQSEGDQPLLLIDGLEDIDETDEYFFTQKVSGLSWSRDGRILAYGRNGLHIYHFDTQNDDHILPNEVEEIDTGMLFPRALYSPYQWSPDDSQLLVNINYYEAGTLGIYTPGSPEILKLGEGIVCCQPSWSPDSQSIVIASPFLGMVDSGLWRIDTNTGIQTELIPATSPDNTLNFVGWPVVLSNNDLFYFYSNTPSFPSGEVPLLLVSSASDGISGRTILRPENWLNYEVLWAENGALAVAVQPVTGEAPGWPRTGPVVVIPPSEDPVIPLGINGYQLQWGP